MENYIETVVAKKNKFTDLILGCFLSFLPIFVGAYLFILLSSIESLAGFAPLALIACLVICYFVYKNFGKFNIEWEYILVGSELRFSKIIDKSKRRDIVSVDMSKTEIIARINDNEHNSSLRSVQHKYDFTSNKTNDYFFMITSDLKGKRVCVLFEPDDRLLENFKTTVRGKLFI